jgi:hypothetical protein
MTDVLGRLLRGYAAITAAQTSGIFVGGPTISLASRRVLGRLFCVPLSWIGSTIYFQDVPALCKALQDTSGGKNPETVGTLAIHAEDSEGNRYQFSTDLELWNGWTWRVWKTERALVKPTGD